MTSLEEYASRAEALSREDFVCQLPGFVLLLQAEAAGRAAWTFKTSRITRLQPDKNAGAALERQALHRYTVVTLQPQEGHAWGNRISVGRASNNDIILTDNSVSKLHAYFSVEEDGTITLRDMESRNGTTVGGEQLPTGGRRPVSSGDEISFGAISCTLLSSADLYDFVRQGLRGSEGTG